MRPRPETLQEVREYPVLYVDDEAENLRIFELTFRREFSIVTARSGEEGLEILNRQPVALVLSDHRMPGMTGSEFLARVAEVDPKTIRVMVTAYGDAETLQDAINNGHIYRFIPKPWTPEDVRATLRRGIEAYALDREREQLVRELTILNRVSASLNQELELERLFDLLIHTLQQEMGYDAVALLLRERQTGRFVWSRMAPGKTDVDDRLRKISLDDHNAGDFVEQLEGGMPQTLRSDGAMEYPPAVRQWVTEVAAEEIVVTPLCGKSGVVGAIVVDNRRGGPSFRADDYTLLEGLCHQAVVAIENARLVEDLRRSREEVRRADRLGTLGTLAAGLAHEINNPLVSIHTFLAMAPEKRFVEDAEFWGEYHALAGREVERIRGLVDTMRRLGQGGASTMPHETVDLVELGREVVTLLQREAQLGHVDLGLEADAETPKVVAVRDQIHQVLLNLVLNALAATPAEGRIQIRTSPLESGEGVQIEVADSGPGILPEHLDHIFDPFFTTKGPDEGSGLGLMVCHRIVVDHGGTLEVRSEEGEGATFRVCLPLDARRGAAEGLSKT